MGVRSGVLAHTAYERASCVRCQAEGGIVSGVRWGLLVRISDDRAGEGAGVERQERDGRAEVARRGGTVAEVYPENDTSAFARKRITLPGGGTALRVVRPEFRRALADLETGRIDGLMVYDLDRLTRDPRDLEDAIDAARLTGRPIAAVTGSVDLSTDHGITSARMLVAVASKSSMDTSRRVKRVHEALAEQGKPSGGRRPYGYTADRKGVVPDEAKVLRELAARRLAGEGWVSLIRDLNRRGIPAASGGPWNLSSIRSAVLKPHAAGIRTLHGRETAAGIWPAVLDRSTWEQLRALSVERRPPTRRYLLSGLARCALCGGGLGGRLVKAVPTYRCSNPACMKISRRAVPLDDYVSGVVVRLLADVDLSAPAADPSIADELAPLLSRRAAVVAAFADVNGDSPAELRRTLDRLDGEIARIRAKVATGQRERLLAGVHGVTSTQWEALPLDTRRAVVAAMVTIQVGRSARGRVPFDVSSVKIEPTY